MKKLICIALCVLMVMAFVACQSSGDADQRGSYTGLIDVPIDGISWGMTQDEIKNVFVEKYNVNEDEIVFSDSTDIGCTLPVDLLGIKTVADLDLPIAEENIMFTFRLYDGVYRLDKVLLFVEAESGQQLQERLLNAYGKPVGTVANPVWISEAPTVNAEKSDFEKLNQADYDTFTRIADGEEKLFTVRPVVVVQGTTSGGTTTEVLNGTEPASFCLAYQGKRYLSSLYGSVVYD